MSYDHFGEVDNQAREHHQKADHAWRFTSGSRDVRQFILLKSRMSLWAAFAVILFITGFASAQDDRTAAEQQYRFTGNGSWVVIKTWTDDPLNKKDRIIADFGNPDDAGECRDKLNKGLNSTAPFYYRARERAKDDPTDPLVIPSTPRGTTITKPVLKSADPGPLKKNEPKAPSLAGKKGTGTIGKYQVTIEFTGGGEMGEFIISGDLEGKGKWLQLGSFVQLETTRAKFEGRLDGDKVGGSRIMKEYGAKDTWSVDFSAKPRTFWIQYRAAESNGTWSEWATPYGLKFDYEVTDGPYESEAAAKSGINQVEQRRRELHAKFPRAQHVPKQFRIVTR